MVATTALDTKTYDIFGRDGAVTTSPPLLSVGLHTAELRHDPERPPLPTRFRRRGLELTLTSAVDGVSLTWAHPHGSLYRHRIEQHGHDWELEIQRSGWATERPHRHGSLVSDGFGTATLDVDYVWYSSEWFQHRRIHRAWITGSLEVECGVPCSVLAMAARLTLGPHWFHLRTGTWTETRREWDFAGF